MRNFLLNETLVQSPDGKNWTVAADLSAQNFSPFQTNQQPLPVTIAAAATIAPSGWLTFISGTTNIATITAPLSGVATIALIFTNGSPGQLLTTGNISVGSTTITQNVLNILTYDPITAKWYLNK
jgi:hypothetical protein